MENEYLALEYEVLESGVWGTIGPHSAAAARALSKLCGSSYALLCHSGSAAYEAVLRSFEPVAGDIVITPSYGDPDNSLVAAAVGAVPAFCDVLENGAISAESLERCLSSHASGRILCVTADYIEDCGNEFAAAAAVCRKHCVPFIINAGGNIKTDFRAASLADAVIYSLDHGSAIDAGGGGFLATDSVKLYSGAYAYHNCGRLPGDGCALEGGDVMGGDFRVSEWTAVVAEKLASENRLAAPGVRTFRLMHREPVFQSGYFIKSTGGGEYSDAGLDNSIKLSGIDI